MGLKVYYECQNKCCEAKFLTEKNIGFYSKEEIYYLKCPQCGCEHFKIKLINESSRKARVYRNEKN